MIKTEDGSFKKAIRKAWITSVDSAFTVYLEDTREKLNIKRGKVAWYYS